jgi:uncharacterized coiled-coil protein SlyX
MFETKSGELTKVMGDSPVIKALLNDVTATRDRVGVLKATIAERQAIITSQQRALVQLEKRLKTIEDQPMPGGPVTRAVASVVFDAPGDPVLKAFETVASVATTEHERLELAQRKLAYLQRNR